jgi:hypothetical protein
MTVGRMDIVVSDIRKAVAWARRANQPVYVLCTEYSPFPCSHGVTTLKQTQDPCVDPSGARCQDPKPSNNCGSCAGEFWWLEIREDQQRGNGNDDDER